MDVHVIIDLFCIEKKKRSWDLFLLLDALNVYYTYKSNNMHICSKFHEI